MKRFFGLLMILMMSMSSIHAQTTTSAEASWSVWVYDGMAATRISAGGSVLQSLILPIPPLYDADEYRLSRGMAVSPDGTLLAYSVSGVDRLGAAVTTFMVYDTLSAEVKLAFQPAISPNADALSLLFNPQLFNLTGATVTYSYAFGDTPDTAVWEVKTFDITTGSTIAAIDNLSPAIAAQRFEKTTAPYLMPQPMAYVGAQLTFALVPYQTYSAQLELDSFTWDVITGRIATSTQFPNLSGDYLQTTGESVTTVMDERINYRANPLQLLYHNALHAYRPTLGGRAPFYAYPTFDFLDAFFVEDGQRVLAYGFDLDAGSPIWLLVDRDGRSQRLGTLNAIENHVINTPEGFVYTTGISDLALVAADTRTDTLEQRGIWVAPTFGAYIPVWAGYSSEQPRPEYGTWAQLAPPLFSAQSVINPEASAVSPDAVSSATPLGNPYGALIINGLAVVNTTSGDRLNMRNAPGLTGTIIARVESGTQVVLIDGPVSRDSYVWWEVRLPTGLIGWLVESADNVRTLLPLNR